VPSGDHDRDQEHRLRWIAAEVVGVTRSRYQRLLRRSTASVVPRAFAPGKYEYERELAGEAVLLIDDTWTTGANAQSAAAALKAAGAGVVGAVVIGRHVNRDWHGNDRRLRALPAFDWTRCVICAPEPAAIEHEATPA
jgi:adenine/guanine phosphoribosyltransferase-like PRPP-binding protein